MRNTKNLIVLSLAALAAVVLAMWAQQDERAESDAGSVVFPGLLDDINQIDRVSVTGPTGPVTMAYRDGAWVVEQRNGYPATRQKVQSLVFGMAELRRVEAKTSKPERYVKLGLTQPAEAEGRAVLVELDAGERRVAALWIGDRKPDAPQGVNQYYVRVPEDSQAWLVEGRLDSDAGRITSWLEPVVIGLDERRVRRVEVRHPDGQRLEVRRESPDTDNFSLAGLQPGEEIESAYGVNNVARSLANLSLDDVLVAEDVDFSDPMTNAVLETFDGIRIRVDLTEKDDARYARLKAEFDAALRDTGADNSDVVNPSAEDPEQWVARHDRLWTGRAYRLPAHQYSGITVRRDELVIRPDEQDTPKQGDS